MAAEVFNYVASAVYGELMSRVFSGLIQRYGKDPATGEKLQRLEMLLIKIHSTVEELEKRNIDNSWLLQWRDKLKEGALQGDEVLARFLQPTKDVEGTSNAEANQQKGEAASSAASATAVRALSFRRNPLPDIVQGIHSASRMLFVSGDDDMERLNKILERLEKLSPDIRVFIRLLHLEGLKKIERMHGPTKMRRWREEKSKRVAHEGRAKRVAHEVYLLTSKEEKSKRVAHEFCLSRIDELDELALVSI